MTARWLKAGADWLNGQWSTQADAEQAMNRLLRPCDPADLM